jgi:RNA polymerase sigma-70 factor (ECF subfamily)
MMSYDCTTDEELMLRVPAGNREAMSPLVRRYASPLLTFIHRMTSDWHQGEELFQEAFLAVWQNRGRYQYPRPFRSWLFGIAANKCRAEFRKALGLSEPLSDWLDPPAVGEPSPVEAAISSETATLVAQAVATLPPKQRAVLVLRLWNGMEYAEIAQALERTEATIRSQMFHALAGMRRYLEPRMRKAGEDCHDQT